MINKAIIIGNLGRDPELHSPGSGKQVCNFSVATKEKWDGGERTDWHRIVVWGRTGENCAKYLSKGSKVYVEGTIQYRDWEDKDGNKRTTTEIKAWTVQFLDSRSDRPGKSSNPPPPAGDHDSNDTFVKFGDDEIPF